MKKKHSEKVATANVLLQSENNELRSIVKDLQTRLDYEEKSSEVLHERCKGYESRIDGLNETIDALRKEGELLIRKINNINSIIQSKE